MKMVVNNFKKRATYVGLAFVMAVSTLSSALPFISSQTANAVGTTTVTPTDYNGWVRSTPDTGYTDAQVQFIYDTTAPVGNGAMKFDAGASSDYTTWTYNVQSSNTDATTINLHYSTKRLAGPSHAAASLVMMVDKDGDFATEDGFYAIYEPVYNKTGSENFDVWNTWNVTQSSKFWYANGYETKPAEAVNYTPLSNLLTNYPSAKIQTVELNFGTGNSGWSVLTDNVKSVDGTIFDFDPTPLTPTPLPVKPALTGDVIYDAISPTLPANYPSLGYAATSTAALGDKIGFTGTSRSLDDVAVTLSSWACENGQGWNSGNCVTTPGSTFSHPVTLNIYNVAGDGTVGSLIASRTQTFDIPYRPTADPTCPAKPASGIPAGTSWSDTNGSCQTGYNHVVVFDAAGIIVPNAIIYSIAFNTQNYGTAPVGASGPFDSLNVGLNADTAAPYAGTDVVPTELFWDTTYPGYTAGLKADSGWDYNIAATFTATTIAGPSLVMPINGAAYKTSDLPKAQSWTSVPGATQYRYESYTEDPVLNPSATPFHTENRSTTSRSIGATAAEGKYWWRVKAISPFQSEWSNVYTFSVDNTAPNISLVSPSNNAVVNGTSLTNQWATTTPSDVDHYVYQSWHDAAMTNLRWEENFTTTSKTATNVPDSTFWWRVKAVDKVGNETWSPLWKVTVDSTAPATPMLQTPANNAVISHNDFWFDWNDVVGAVSYEMQNSTDPTVNASGSFQNVMWTGDYQQIQPNESKSRSVGANGTWYWQVRAVDAAGNKSAWTAPWSVTIDMVKPTSTHDLTSLVKGTVTINQTVTDNFASKSGKLRIWKLTNGVADNSKFYAIGDVAVDVNGKVVYTLDTLTKLFGDGQYIAKFTATDKAGNASIVEKQFTVDNTAPSLTVNAVASTSNTTPIITGTTSELSSDVVIVLDGSEIATVTSDASGNWSWTSSTPLTIGSHTIIATATDAAGNTSSSDISIPQNYWKQFVVQAPAITQNSTANNTTPQTQAVTTNDGDAVDVIDDTVVGDALGTQDQVNDAIVGTSDEDSNQVSAAGASDSKGATNNDSWNVFGIAWYWWLLIIAALVSLWWLVAARRHQGVEK